ncbi:MAG: DNA and RNA helicase [archaeon GW2011_AR6]|nr:MAG: DNA and RNA helicase [archaeon GW2011_AR6]
MLFLSAGSFCKKESAMDIIADLQIHSKHSRATSKNLSFESLEKYGRIKGLGLMGVGDFQHPIHRQEIKENLKEDEYGLLWTKTKFPFMWQTEVSLMFSQDGKRRAVHLLIFAPNGETADQIIEYLGSKGRLDYDGRPIFGITCRDLVKDLKSISDKIEIIPAHCMTPWFGLYGSKSGFDSLKECFQDQSSRIYAIESGMSADPSMLWRFKEDVNIVSFSDAHSHWPWRIGREATIFDLPELEYEGIMNAIRTGKGFKATIETPPAYGKYHWDGHRACNFSCAPEETNKLKGKCPKCGKDLTIGVDFRVEELAKAKHGYKPDNARQFFSLLPLHELIAFSIGSPLASRKTWEIYNALTDAFKSELDILLNIEKAKLARVCDEKLLELITRNRESRVKVKPGYDGTYGEIVLEHEEQKKLF